MYSYFTYFYIYIYPGRGARTQLPREVEKLKGRVRETLEELERGVRVVDLRLLVLPDELLPVGPPAFRIRP